MMSTPSQAAKKRKPFEPHRAVRSLTGGERERCKIAKREGFQTKQLKDAVLDGSCTGGFMWVGLVRIEIAGQCK